TMRRLSIIALVLTTAALLPIDVRHPLAAQARRGAPAKAAPAKPFSVVEAGIPELRAAMEQGRTTSRQIVHQYLTRIALYEDRLNAVITINPRALAEAEERDRERVQGKIRGPLHGIP